MLAVAVLLLNSCHAVDPTGPDDRAGPSAARGHEILHHPADYRPWDLLQTVFTSAVTKAPLNEPVRIIGAGLSRTGTSSMRSALSALNYKAYHAMEGVDNFDFPVWFEFVNVTRNATTLIRLLNNRGYNATLDWPANLIYKDLMRAYPSAKVILTVRDNSKGMQVFTRLPLRLYPKVHNFTRVLEFNHGWGLRAIPFNEMAMASCEAGYERWNADVIASVPVDRLLVFNVKEGWAPLCLFLGLHGADCPSSPFPRVNDGAQMDQVFAAFNFICDYWIPATMVIVALVVWLCVWLFSCFFRRASRPRVKQQ